MDWNDDRVSAFEITPQWSGSLPISAVDEALKAHGIEDKYLPNQPSRAVCLRRAIDKVADRGAKIDMLPKGQGVSLSLKDVDNLDLDNLTVQAGTVVRSASSYRATLTAKVIVTRDSNKNESISLQFTPEDHPLVPMIRDLYELECDNYKMSEDISQWFSLTIVPLCHGIGKRSRGGVYYVPAYKKDLLKKVVDALASVSVSSVVERKVGGVRFPVSRLSLGGKICVEARYAEDADCMEIMVDGLIRDTDSAIDDLQACLETPKGSRALRTKAEEAVALAERMKRWEETCSVSLELLKDRLTEIHQKILVAEFKEDK
jgi:hypothetical protein